MGRAQKTAFLRNLKLFYEFFQTLFLKFQHFNFYRVNLQIQRNFRVKLSTTFQIYQQTQKIGLDAD